MVLTSYLVCLPFCLCTVASMVLLNRNEVIIALKDSTCLQDNAQALANGLSGSPRINHCLLSPPSHCQTFLPIQLSQLLLLLGLLGYHLSNSIP